MKGQKHMKLCCNLFYSMEVYTDDPAEAVQIAAKVPYMEWDWGTEFTDEPHEDEIWVGDTEDEEEMDRKCRQQLLDGVRALDPAVYSNRNRAVLIKLGEYRKYGERMSEDWLPEDVHEKLRQVNFEWHHEWAERHPCETRFGKGHTRSSPEMFVTCKVVAELFVDTDDVAEAIEIASSEAYGEWSVLTDLDLCPPEDGIEVERREDD
jgi:hypothetical protein